jgi:hypothetical protein
LRHLATLSDVGQQVFLLAFHFIMLNSMPNA